MVQIPLEGLALEVLSQLQPGADVPVLSLVVPDPLVLLLVVIQPHLKHGNHQGFINIDLVKALINNTMLMQKKRIPIPQKKRESRGKLREI